MNTATHPPIDILEQAILAAGEAAPDTVEALLALPKLKIFTDALKAHEGPSGERVFRATASSTIKDLHGDFMTEDCVRDMALQARKGPTGSGLTIFLNHSYKVPEDVAGKVASTQVLNRENDGSGVPIWDMDYEIRLAKGVPGGRLDQTWSLIKDEQISLGISIGAYILEYDFIDKEEGFWGGLIINKVLLVETSIVGIPANQRSWVQNGVIAIGKHLGFEEKQIRRVLDGKEAAPLMKTASLDAQPPTQDETPADDDAGEEDSGEAPEAVAAGSTDITKETCPECGGNSEKCGCKAAPNPITNSADEALEVTADAAPDTESTDEQPPETTVETPSGETTEAATSALNDVAPEIALSLKDGSAPAVELVLAALEHAAETLRDVRAEKATLQAKNEALEAERDQAIKDRNDAAEIIALVARAPLGRKTQFAAPVQSFEARFGAIYDRSFLKLIDETE